MTETLFDMDAPVIDMARLDMRITNRETAERWMARYHYSGTAGVSSSICFGAFAPDMIAVVTVAEATNAHGVAKRYGLVDIPGNMEISRVAVHPDAPRNTASRVIRMACRQYHRLTKREWLFSYADTGQNHHGGIYQALNAVYVGVSPPRHGFLVDGVPTHPRTIVTRYKTQAWPRVRDIAALDGVTIEKIADMNTAKHTYILPIGDRRSERRVRDAVARYARPYPKR